MDGHRPRFWIALGTLTFLEIVLGVDNIIFISILSGKLPPSAAAGCAQDRAARRDAHAHRAAVLAGVGHQADRALFTLVGHEISGRDLILILGGPLPARRRAPIEIHDKLEGEEGHASRRGRGRRSPA